MLPLLRVLHNQPKCDRKRTTELLERPFDPVGQVSFKRIRSTEPDIPDSTLQKIIIMGIATVFLLFYTLQFSLSKVVSVTVNDTDVVKNSSTIIVGIKNNKVPGTR